MFLEQNSSGHLFDTSQLFAASEPEGFIIKNHKFVYQTSTHERVLDHKERTQYEYLLIDFSSFWESIDDIYALIGTQTMCTVYARCSMHMSNGSSESH